MTLTEQWKKGELKRNKYWIKYKNGKIDTWELSEGITIESKPEIIEVLAPVPSFEEYNRLKEVERKKGKLVNVNYKIKRENQQLKELLKEWCKFYPIVLYEYEDILKTKDIVELYDKTTSVIGEKK